MKRKQKCKVCGSRFYIDRKDTYQVYESVPMAKVFSENAKTLDAVDCPQCGCQQLLGIRLAKVSKLEVHENEETQM